MTTEHRPDERPDEARQPRRDDRSQARKDQGPAPDQGPGHRETEREFL